MFKPGFNSEKAIKLLAQILFWASIAIAVISAIAAMIVLGVAGEDDGLISLFILVGGLLWLLCGIVSAIFLWAFGDITGSVVRLAKGAPSSTTQIADAEDELPEL